MLPRTGSIGVGLDFTRLVIPWIVLFSAPYSKTEYTKIREDIFHAVYLFVSCIQFLQGFEGVLLKYEVVIQRST